MKKNMNIFVEMRVPAVGNKVTFQDKSARRFDKAGHQKCPARPSYNREIPRAEIAFCRAAEGTGDAATVTFVMEFRLVSSYQPQGDQGSAIESLTRGLLDGDKHQVLLGVTGSGKTFTMAKIIEQLNRPALILAHNKTLAAQLYHEFKSFFPHNAVEYFVSYYDYYQPEAYIPAGRCLHREGSDRQRRARQAAAGGHQVAVRAARLHHRGVGELHLRPGFARRLLRHAAVPGEGTEDQARRHRPQAGRDSLRAHRGRLPPRHLPRARRHHRDFPHLRGQRLSHRVMGR